MRAAIYSRYSTDLQDKTSIAGQFRNCEDFCERNGFEIVARQSDEDRLPAFAGHPLADLAEQVYAPRVVVRYGQQEGDLPGLGS